jgi:hypothetical protein
VAEIDKKLLFSKCRFLLYFLGGLDEPNFGAQHQWMAQILNIDVTKKCCMAIIRRVFLAPAALKFLINL